jgi:hypothetical protein
MSIASTWNPQLTRAQLAHQEYMAWRRLREQGLVPAPAAPFIEELSPVRDCGVAAVQAGLLAD